MKRIILLVVLLGLAGCPFLKPDPGPQYETFAKANETLMKAPVQRVQFKFHAACNDATGKCLVDKQRLVDATDVITKLNDSIDASRLSYNQLVNALTECEYGSALRGATIQYQKKQSFQQSIIYGIKEVATAGICGVLLLH